MAPCVDAELPLSSAEAETMADINLTPAVVIWIILAIATLGLALYRKLISASEADLIHLGPGEEQHIPQQIALETKLKAVDHWGKMLTVITVVVGLVTAAIYLYQAFLVHK